MKFQESCRAYLPKLSLYISGEAEEALCTEIERHLEVCENCRIVVDTLRKTILLYRTWGGQDLPEDTKERLYHILDIDTFLDEHDL